MRFSIIIPAYNSELYIRKALDSVKHQVFRDYELIVICDNCIDRTYEIAREYTNNVYRVSYNNDGLTRSYGLDRATGEYVLFMDDDDWWLHEFVLTQLDQKLKETRPDILAFSFIYKTKGYAHPLGNLGKLWPAVWNKCWRRTSIGSTRFPNEPLVSDLRFHEEMMGKNLKIETWDMPMYYYNYMRVGSQTEKGRRR